MIDEIAPYWFTLSRMIRVGVPNIRSIIKKSIAQHEIRRTDDGEAVFHDFLDAFMKMEISRLSDTERETLNLTGPSSYWSDGTFSDRWHHWEMGDIRVDTPTDFWEGDDPKAFVVYNNEVHKTLFIDILTTLRDLVPEISGPGPDRFDFL